MIDTTILELFELAPPSDYDSYLFKRLEHDITQKKLSISIRSFAPVKYGIVTFHSYNRTTLVFSSLHF